MSSKLVLLAVLFTGTGQGDVARDESARFVGVWRFATVEVNGMKQAPPSFETDKLIIWGDGRYIVAQGSRITRGVIQFDPAKTPKHYNVTVVAGAKKRPTTLGLYELNGDTYRVCLPLFSKERPAAISSKPGMLYFVFKREKQPVREALEAAGRQELAGRWQAVSYALNGSKATDEQMKKVQLVIDEAGRCSAFSDGKLFIASTSRLDPAQEPMAIDMTYTEGDHKGTTSLGIYKIEDGLLTICRTPAGKPRPTEFVSTPGSKLTLMTYRRDTAAK